MLLIISPPLDIVDEFQLVNVLLQSPITAFHIRKPTYSPQQLKYYLEKINPLHYSKLVLHQHHDIAAEYGITRLHFNALFREEGSYIDFVNNYQLSTSVHSIHEFNLLSPIWDYAFCSPVFPSISKPNYNNAQLLNSFKRRTNYAVKLIGLGGISLANKELVIKAGADGVALLGSIWNSENPIDEIHLLNN